MYAGKKKVTRLRSKINIKGAMTVKGLIQGSPKYIEEDE